MCDFTYTDSRTGHAQATQIIGSLCVKIMYAKFMAPVQVQNIQQIVRARTACSSHGFGLYGTLKQPGSFMWPRHMWSPFPILSCNLKCSNAPFTWSFFVVFRPHKDQNPENLLIIAWHAVPPCTSFRRFLEHVAGSWAYHVTTFRHGLCMILACRRPMDSHADPIRVR